MDRICPQCGKAFTPSSKHPRKIYCSRLCGGASQPRRFDVSPERLRELVWSMPTRDVAAMFGVTDNAVNKRLRRLGIQKPKGRGHWNKLAAGKVDERGSELNPIIYCDCGCGRRLRKFSGGKRRRPRRYISSHHPDWERRLLLHNSQRRESNRRRGRERGWQSRERIDINVIALRQFHSADLDSTTKTAFELAKGISERFFCEYIGPVWIAVSAAIARGEFGRDLEIAAKVAVKQYWRSCGDYGVRSTDEMKNAVNWEPTFAMLFESLNGSPSAPAPP